MKTLSEIQGILISSLSSNVLTVNAALATQTEVTSLPTLLTLLNVKEVQITTSAEQITLPEPITLQVTGSMTLYGGEAEDVVFKIVQANATTQPSSIGATLRGITMTGIADAQNIPSSKLPRALLPTNTFQEVLLAADTATKKMSVGQDQSPENYPLPLAVIGIPQVSRIGFNYSRMIVAGTTQSVSFGLFGSFPLGPLALRVMISFPVAEGDFNTNWTLGFTFEGLEGEELSLGDLIQLLAGNNLFQMVPTQLTDVISHFTLRLINISFNPSKVDISSISVTVSTIKPWVLVQNALTLEGAEIFVNIVNPFNSPVVNLFLSGQFRLGEEAMLGYEMFLTSGSSDWEVNFSASVPINGIAGLSGIPGGLDSNDLNLPANVSSATLEINEFRVVFNPSSRTLNSISLNILLDAKWEFVANDVLAISKPFLQLEITNPLNSNRRIALVAGGNVTIAKKKLSVVATVSNAPTTWSFTAELAQGTTIDLIESAVQLVQPFVDFSVDDLPTWVTDQDLKITQLGIKVFNDPAKNSTNYEFWGTTVTQWNFDLGSLPPINATASWRVTYNSVTKKPEGVISVQTEIAQMKFIAGYQFAVDPKTNLTNQTLTLDWNGFKFSYTSGKEIKLTLGDWTVGEIIEALINIVFPSQERFSLSTPWNVLNSISLKGLELVVDLSVTPNVVRVVYKLSAPINLGFINITGLGLTKDDTGVVMYIDGSSPVPTVNESSLFDKLKGQDVQQMPAVPGEGGAVLDLRLLAMGQRVKVAGSSEFKNITEAINAMRCFPQTDGFKNPVSGTPAKGQPVFDNNSNWLAATNFGVLGFKDGTGKTQYTLDLSIIFNDPNLYGLRITMAGEKAKIFDGLAFEILYKKVSDSVGVYQIDLSLPNRMRRLQFGTVTIILPSLFLQIYTNGDFLVDIGFPHNFDFTRSFTIQAIVYPGIPLMGSGGFYFGKLSSATTNKVPKTSKGSFNPVLVFGIGGQFGLGYSIDYGVISGGFSATFVGMIEGVLASYNPYDPSTEVSNSGVPTQMDGAFYYWVQGTFGIMGKLYGSVNLGIVSASFNLEVIATVSATFESFRAIPIVFLIKAKIEFSLKINLGLFSIKINFKFQFQFKLNLTIGTDKLDQAPWYDGKQLAARQRVRQRRPQVRKLSLKSVSNLQSQRATLSAVDHSLNLWFVPVLSVSGTPGGSISNQQANYVTTLFIDGPNLDNGTGDGSTSFEKLAQGVLNWVVINFQQSHHLPTNVVSRDELEDLYATLNDPNNPTPIPYNDILTFLSQTYTMNVVKPPTGGVANAAVFPVFAEMLVSYPNPAGGDDLTTDFGAYSQVTDQYVSTLRAYFAELQVQVQQELNPNGPRLKAALSATPSQSLAAFVMEDYILLLARQMVQFGTDSLSTFDHILMPGDTIAGIVAAVNEFGNGVAHNNLTAEVLVRGNATHPLAADGSKSIQVTGVIPSIGENDTFASLAAPFMVPVEAVILLNADIPYLILPEIEVKLDGKTFKTHDGDTINAVAAGLGTTPQLLAADPTFQSQSPLLVPTRPFLIAGTRLPLPSQSTLSGISQQFAPITVSELGQFNRFVAGILTPNTEIDLGNDQKHLITSTDTLQSVADSLKISVDALVNNPAVKDNPAVLLALGPLMIPAFPHLLVAGDSFESLAQAFSTTTDALAQNWHNQMIADLFDRNGEGNAALALNDLAFLPLEAIQANILKAGSMAGLYSMASRYMLHGMRVPINDQITFPNGGPCVGQDTCALYQATGQQFALPTSFSPEKTYTVSLKKSAALDWLQFDGSTTNLSIPVPLSQDTEIPRINAVRNFALQNGVQPPISEIRALANFLSEASRYSFPSVIPLQSADPVSLPISSNPAQRQPALNIWSFPQGLLSLANDGKLLPPKASVQIGVLNPTTGKMVQREASEYGWSTLLTVSIKRAALGAIPTVNDAFSFELIGVNEVEAILLERLLASITPQTASNVIDSIQLLYGQNPASSDTAGLLSDGPSNFASFITQSNLSTDTNPPTAALASAKLDAEEDMLQGILNTPYDFLRLLWQASIVRSGGYAFYYSLPASGETLPESVFSDDGIGQFNLLIIYKDPSAANQLRNYMNAAVTGDTINVEEDRVFAQSEAQPVMVSYQPATTTIGLLARDYRIQPEQLLAELTAPLSTATAKVAVQEIVYEVHPGDTLESIASYFSAFAESAITPAMISALNPGVVVQTWALLRIPDLVYPVSATAGGPGTSWTGISQYFGPNLAQLATANLATLQLYAAGTQLSFADQVINRSPATPAGTGGFFLERPPIIAPTVATSVLGFDDAYARDYLNSLYNLLTYQVAANPNFSSTVNGVPVGPLSTSPDTESNRTRTSVPEGDGENSPQVYENVTPLANFAINRNMIAEAGLPSIAENPYAGIGLRAQFHLDWVDIFGNQTVTPLSVPTLAPSQPLNNPPVSLGYGDALLALSQWPSVASAYQIAKDQSGKIFLTLYLAFSEDNYVDDGSAPSDSGLPLWQQNAGTDRITYTTLFYQLNQRDAQGNLTTSMALSSSLFSDPTRVLDSGQFDVLNQFAKDIYLYLDARYHAQSATPPSCVSVDFEVDLNAVNPANIFDLTATLTVMRPEALIAPEFRFQPRVQSSGSDIQPLIHELANCPLVPQTPTLLSFAQTVEDAMRTSDYVFKVATASPPPGSETVGQEKQIWLVRMGLNGQQPISLNINTQQPIFFAPRPLSNTLTSRNQVPIFSYTPGSGIDFGGPSTPTTFNNIDMDVWGSRFLESVDAFLNPELANPAFIVDHIGGEGYLETILAAKQTLAEAISGQIEPILTVPAITRDANPKNFEVAEEKLKQQLLIELASAYSVNAVVQFDTQTKTGEANGPDITFAPKMFGQPATLNENVEGATANPNGVISLSTAKVPLLSEAQNEDSYLTFLFSTRNVASSSEATLDLVYDISHLEHNIRKLETIEGYFPSDWLTFVITPNVNPTDNPLHCAIGQVQVPILLRAYPSLPSLLTQDSEKVLEQGITPEEVIEAASQWNYVFRYSQSHAAQDRIHSEMWFNLSQGNLPNLKAGAPTYDLFNELAEFITVSPAVLADLNASLSQITVKTSATDPSFKIALGALQALATLSERISIAWKEWSDMMRLSNTLLKMGFTEKVYRMTVIEQKWEGCAPPFSPTEDLEIIVLPAAEGNTADMPFPLIEIDGYTTETVCTSAESISYRYKLDGTTDQYLSFADAQNIPDRKVKTAVLNAFGFQNAWSSIFLVRNQFLLSGDKADEETNPIFVYATPKVKFSNPFFPLLDQNAVIDISDLIPATEGKQPLSAYLSKFFEVFFAEDEQPSQTVKLVCAYSYTLSEEQFRITLPVLYAPPTPFLIPQDYEVPAGGCLPLGSPDASFVCNLSNTLNGWFAQQQPSQQNGLFHFDVSVFSDLNESKKPLVWLRNVVLDVGRVAL